MYKLKWTLEEAREDYEKILKKICENCKFSLCEKHRINEHCARVTLICEVKNQKIINNNAQKCKYFTVK